MKKITEIDLKENDRLEARPKTPEAGQNWRTRPKAPDARLTKPEVRERMCDYVTEPRARKTQQTGFSAAFLGIDAAIKLLKQEFPVEQVVLFGSKASGRDDTESDIDLLVITDRSLDWGERGRLTDALFDVELEYDVVISTIIVSRDEWETGAWTVLPIKDEIERNGVAA